MFATRPAVTAAFLGTLLAVPAARADGPPGTCECAVTPAAPSPAATPRLPRWGVGLHVASVTMPGAMDGGDTSYGGGGLQVRYRLSPRWQLELAAAHVTEQDVDAAVARQLDTVALAAIYHLRPAARWDFYLLRDGARPDPGLRPGLRQHGALRPARTVTIPCVCSTSARWSSWAPTVRWGRAAGWCSRRPGSRPCSWPAPATRPGSPPRWVWP